MSYAVVKRVLDVAGAAMGLIIASPLLVIASLAILLEDGAPAVFRQERIGLHGRTFLIYKLRTMTQGSGDNTTALQPADPRVTRVGKVLRATSVDELPQFVNILKGEMSLVGPRPTLSYQVDQYESWQKRRHEVRPGVTGWAQVNGRNRLPWADRIKLDVWYVERMSFALDLKIVGLTIKRVFSGTDTYAEGGGTLAFDARTEA